MTVKMISGNFYKDKTTNKQMAHITYNDNGIIRSVDVPIMKEEQMHIDKIMSIIVSRNYKK